MAAMNMSNLPHLEGDIIAPDYFKPVLESVSRWSSTGVVERPALTIIPNTEEDIIKAIDYAKKHALQLLPVGGGHGFLAPITSKTLYLDLKRFNKVEVDSDNQTVTVGGGAVTSQLIKECTERGFYTTWPNSNAIGVVGCILGGGNPTLLGLHGLMIDHVLSIRLVTSDKGIVAFTPSSTGDDLALFNALCGAGHGFGVITSLTMRIFPMENLRLSENQVWICRLIFPASEIELAANLFDQLQHPPPPMVALLVFARAPPTAPKPGAPMVILTVSYFGPPEEAEARTSTLFEDETVAKAIMAQTVLTPLSKINDGNSQNDVHGGFKNIQAAWIKETQPETIKVAFSKWLDFTTQHDDAKRTAMILNSVNTQKQLEIQGTSEGQDRYFDARDRGIQAVVISWFTKQETQPAAADFAASIKALYRQNDATDLPRTILNNIDLEMELREVLSEHKVLELKRLAKVWDPSGLFWRPWK